VDRCKLGLFRYKYHDHRPLFRSSHTIDPLSLHIAQQPTLLKPHDRFRFTSLIVLSFSSCGKSARAAPLCIVVSTDWRGTEADDADNSGIFGYINYLVEKDRKYILDTLVKGTWLRGWAVCFQTLSAEWSAVTASSTLNRRHL
jgi:hypothetical protein